MTKAVQKRETTEEVGVRVNTEMNRLVSQAPREAEGEGLTGMLDRILSYCRHRRPMPRERHYFPFRRRASDGPSGY